MNPKPTDSGFDVQEELVTATWVHEHCACQWSYAMGASDSINALYVEKMTEARKDRDAALFDKEQAINRQAEQMNRADNLEQERDELRAKLTSLSIELGAAKGELEALKGAAGEELHEAIFEEEFHTHFSGPTSNNTWWASREDIRFFAKKLCDHAVASTLAKVKERVEKIEVESLAMLINMQHILSSITQDDKPKEAPAPPSPDPDGWIPHRPGDPMPCDGEMLVDYKLRASERTDTTQARDLRWTESHGPNRPNDIISWRPSQPAIPNPPAGLHIITDEESRMQIPEGAKFFDKSLPSGGWVQSVQIGDVISDTQNLVYAFPDAQPTPEEFVLLGPDDVPYGTLFRFINAETVWAAPSAVHPEGIAMPGEGVILKLDWKWLAAKAEISRDNGKTWEPCKKPASKKP